MGLIPTATFEELLADACEALQAKGAAELDDFVDGLNARGVQARRGGRWTAAALLDEWAQLGGAEGAHARVALQPAVAQPFAPAPASADELLRTGLLDLWYLVASSGDVRDRPVPLRRLGRNLVLYRDAGGTLRALEDYCPHRGAPLSLGVVSGDRVVCPYHGFEIDGDGTIAHVPGTADCPLEGRRAVRTYPVREINGAIFVYVTDRTDAVPPEPALTEEFTSPEWTGFLFCAEWRCNWQVALDNRVDPLHGSFLHTGTFTLGRGRKNTELQVRKTEHGFETVRDNQRGVNIDWHEARFVPGNILLVRTEIPYPEIAGGGTFRINGHPTPIDADRTFVWFLRSRKLSGWRRDLWRFLYVQRLEARAQGVVEQDRILLEALPLACREREMLAQSDIAVGRMRRLIRDEAQRQFEARSAAPQPAAVG